MTNLKLAYALASVLLFAPACTSENLSTKGQMIECDVATRACQPVESDSGAAGTCVDIDEDGDGDDHDSEDEADDHANLTGDTDDDDDGIADADDADDDNDGVDDSRDCDELPGHDDDDSADGL